MNSYEKMKELYLDHMRKHLPSHIAAEVMANLLQTEVGKSIIECSAIFAMDIQEQTEWEVENRFDPFKE